MGNICGSYNPAVGKLIDDAMAEIEKANPGLKGNLRGASAVSDATVHGLGRDATWAAFGTWTEEAATFPHAVVETTLGHTVGNAAERAYRRTDLLGARRGLMDTWGRFCERHVAGDANVIELRRA